MAKLELVNVGAQNYVVAERVVAILDSKTAPIRRVIRQGKDDGTVLDASQHRELQALVVLDDGHLIGTFLPTSVLVRRFEDPGLTHDALDEEWSPRAVVAEVVPLPR